MRSSEVPSCRKSHPWSRVKVCSMAPPIVKRPLCVVLSASRSEGGSDRPRRAYVSSDRKVSLRARKTSTVSASRTERAFSRARRSE
jgi:hypothetical protein